MNLHTKAQIESGRQRGSVLIIVLWVAIGLISITLYFADSMSMELRASDNRTSGFAAEQAIEGAARYVTWALANYATNGAIPTNTQFTCEDIHIGDARVWIIGRGSDPRATAPAFGLIDEASKLNINRATTNTLACLPNMTYDLAEAITDWRNTNGYLSLNYSVQGYDAKYAPFETVDELRLIYGMTLKDLIGTDANRNGILDGEETSANNGKESTPGLLEYTTVYSREPNFHSDGSSLTNVNQRAQLEPLLQAKFGSSRVDQILNSMSYTNMTMNFQSPLRFYLSSQLSADDFAMIDDDITVSTNDFIYGRVNINTASEDVLVALFMGANIDEQTAIGAADTLISYRSQNAGYLSSIAWMVTALGRDNTVVNAMAARNWITTRSFQFTADIAAVGPYGRGYRRVKFVFDTTDGIPKIIYRQDLSRLGWALGSNVRETLLAKTTQ